MHDRSSGLLAASAQQQMPGRPANKRNREAHPWARVQAAGVQGIACSSTSDEPSLEGKNVWGPWLSHAKASMANCLFYMLAEQWARHVLMLAHACSSALTSIFIYSCIVVAFQASLKCPDFIQNRVRILHHRNFFLKNFPVRNSATNMWPNMVWIYRIQLLPNHLLL